MKKNLFILLIASGLILSGCGTPPGQIPDNIIENKSEDNSDLDYVVDPEKSNEALLQAYRNAVISNASKYINTSLALDLDEFDFLDDLNSYIEQKKTQDNIDVNAEYNNRLNSFVVTKGEVLVTDTVNVTITKYDSVDDDSASNLEAITYNIDLSKNDSDIGKAIVSEKKEIGSSVSVDDCKLPDGKTAKITAKINYSIRKANDLDMDALISSMAQGETYKTWLEKAVNASSTVNYMWDYLSEKTQFKESINDVDFNNYFNLKFSNACDYYHLYDANADTKISEEEIKNAITAQIKKEIIIYYYKEQILELVSEDTSSKDAIIAFYGYSEDGFKKKFDVNVRNNTLEVDDISYKLYKLYNEKNAK